jgi:RNA polymerase sigma factor (sigma-70 family)
MEMSVSTPQKKQWVITQDSFDKLLARLDPDRERAGERYEKIRRKLVKLFLSRGCSHAEECADETFNRVAQKLFEGISLRAKDPYPYFHGVALNILREYQRGPGQLIDSLEDIPPSKSLSKSPDEIMSRELERLELERLFECLNQCLQKLPPESRDLFTKYHHGEEPLDKARRKELARSLGIPVNVLRVRAHRIRVEIEKCVEGCFESRRRKPNPPT